MTSQFLKSERLFEVISRIFTPSVILQIYEESIKEKKMKDLAAANAVDKENRRTSITGAWRKNMKSNHNLDLSGIHPGIVE